MKPAKCLLVFVSCAVVFAGRAAVRADDTVDVTAAVQRAVQGNSLDVVASNDLGGDPASTVVKKLKVEYTLNGTADAKTVAEYGKLMIHPPKGVKLVVTKAVYGDLPNEHKLDVTGVLADAVQSDKLSLPVNNESLHGDPNPGAGKTLVVNYTVGGKPCKVSIGEGETLNLPLSKDGTGALSIVSATYGTL